MGLTIDTTGFTKDEASLAIKVIHLNGQAEDAYRMMRYWMKQRDIARKMVKACRNHQKKISGQAYRAEYRLEKMIGYEEGIKEGRRFLGKSDLHCFKMDESERGRYAGRGSR